MQDPLYTRTSFILVLRYPPRDTLLKYVDRYFLNTIMDPLTVSKGPNKVCIRLELDLTVILF